MLFKESRNIDRQVQLAQKPKKPLFNTNEWTHNQIQLNETYLATRPTRDQTV